MTGKPDIFLLGSPSILSMWFNSTYMCTVLSDCYYKSGIVLLLKNHSYNITYALLFWIVYQHLANTLLLPVSDTSKSSLSNSLLGSWRFYTSLTVFHAVTLSLLVIPAVWRVMYTAENYYRNLPWRVKVADAQGWQPYHLHLPTV
jgi:hypothetical protein